VGDLRYDLGLGFYRHCDLVIGCLDNLRARSQVGRSCALAGRPYLDGAMWSLGGEVRWFTAGDGPCFDCTLQAGDRERAGQRQSCTGFRHEVEPTDEIPTVVSTAAIIGGLLAQEAAKWICGYPVTAGKALVYNGQALTLHRAEIARNPDCGSSHEAYTPVIELPRRAAELTAREVLTVARARGGPQDPLILELGRDFLCELSCPGCGNRQAVNRVLAQVPESEQTCPRCGAGRRADVIRSVEESSPLADRPLADLGVPPGEVLAVHSPAGLWLYELSGDIGV
jgi:adenylyltransferase/sulfurtransferase